MGKRKSLAVLASVDPVLRESTVFNLVMDRPGTVVLRMDFVSGPEGDGIRRVVLDAGGVVEDVVVPLEHSCLSCATREDALPTLARLSLDPRWTALVLALPVSADSFPVCCALEDATEHGGPLRGLRLTAVMAALSRAGFAADLLGDDMLAERGLALTVDDDRSLGEALAAQVGHADLVLVADGDVESVGRDDLVSSDLIDHLRGPDSRRVDGLHSFEVAELFTGRHDAAAAEHRVDPMSARAVPDAPTDHGVWSIELRSDRPFHPERLVELVDRLGQGSFRARGHFWVPSRPDSVCFWDGAGGQLSVGAMAEWGEEEPRTCLVFTGVGALQTGLRTAFEQILLTPEEFELGFHPWLGRDDVLEPWLGARTSA